MVSPCAAILVGLCQPPWLGRRRTGGVSANLSRPPVFQVEVSLWLFPFPRYQMVPWLQWPSSCILYLYHAYSYVGSICKYVTTCLSAHPLIHPLIDLFIQ